MMSVLRKKYKKKIVPELMKKLKEKNEMAIPAMEKIVVNTGIGEAIKNKEILTQSQKDLASITGQAPSVRRAKASVASFGVRKGAPIGLKVTLRGDKMYDFFDKLTTIVLPRLRDFRGVSKDSFDGRGNYSLGIREQVVFPEADAAKTANRSLEITIVTSTNSDKKSKELLERLGMPFEKEEPERKI